MSTFEVLLFAIGLSMDAFAVSICKGMCMKKLKITHLLTISFTFGFFQFLMPLIGFYLTSSFGKYIMAIDHYIAFFLLMFIGIKMIREKDEDEQCCDVKQKINFKELLILGIATSIDALAVGVTFSFYENFNILKSTILIGAVTFIICIFGIILGKNASNIKKDKAKILGGVVLCTLGLKILLEGIGII